MAALAHRPIMPRLVRRYILYRRSLGYAVSHAGLLRTFGQFAERTAPGQPITTALALRWATSGSWSREQQVVRLIQVRGFAKYCAILDPRTEIPSARLLGPYYVRRHPHIFTAHQVRLLMRRSKLLSTKFSPLAPLTYETLIGLLACTGMRSGEARRLRLTDFDSAAGTLRIAPSKFSPARAIPLHRSVVTALELYCRRRRRLFPATDHFFVGRTGQPLQDVCVYAVLSRLTAGISPSGDRTSLRLTDFRHSFATKWIAQWALQSKPVSHHLLLLARYLGHKDFNSTWWYISSDPKTLQAAATTFLSFHQRSSHEAE